MLRERIELVLVSTAYKSIILYLLYLIMSKTTNTAVAEVMNFDLIFLPLIDKMLEKIGLSIIGRESGLRRKKSNFAEFCCFQQI